MKRLLLSILTIFVFLSGCQKSSSEKDDISSDMKMQGDMPPGDMPPGDMPPGDMPPGPPPGGASSVSKVSATEGYWSFDVVTKGEDESFSVLTYYAGKSDDIVIIPSILGGADVKEIAAQAFGHHSEIRAVYVPSSVTTLEDWAFYDLNEAGIISFANPDISISGGAFQSSGNAALYLPEESEIVKAGGKNKVSDGTSKISLEIVNPGKAAIAGGDYLNVSGKFQITLDDIADISVSTENGTIKHDGSSIIFTGADYEAKVEVISIFEDFTDMVSTEDLKYTFRSLTAEEAESLNTNITANESFGDVISILKFEKGYYLNGNSVKIDIKAKAFNVETGENIDKNANNLFPSTGLGQFKYVAYRDTDADGDIDILYYSPFSSTYTYNSVKISSSSNKYLNGLAARDILNPNYLAFANAVYISDNTEVKKEKLIITSSKDGATIETEANEERSLLWATNYGTIDVGTIHGESTSKGNWAKMSNEAGLYSYNVEIVMEWGMNALLYATNGGRISVGDLNGEVSTLKAGGDGANGIIAGGAGLLAGQSSAPQETAQVYLYNTELELTGWNNHVADVVYGGYAYLENIKSVTGIAGSYSVGQASALANDFGNGVVDAVDFHTTVYGNRSAGAYVIGGGVITAKDSSFTSYMDGGLVSASGGTFIIDNSEITGQMAFRNRGGDSPDTKVIINNSTLIARKDLTNYISGTQAEQAIKAWEKAKGDKALIHFMMSDPDMNLEILCKNYNISGDNKETLFKELSDVAGKTYTGSTKIRGSVLDNTFYNYSAGAYTGSTDFSDIPYLTVGSSFGGLVSSVLEFEAAGEQVTITNSNMINKNTEDYNYLIASEAGSNTRVTIINSEIEGLIWNEGDVSRAVEGRDGNRSSSLEINFKSSHLIGSTADGSKGLWDVDELSYTNSAGKQSSLNGNYYGAEANGNLSALFDSSSVWTVTSTSFLGKLTLEKGAIIQGEEGSNLKFFVNGKQTELVPGTYSGNIEFRIVN